VETTAGSVAIDEVALHVQTTDGSVAIDEVTVHDRVVAQGELEGPMEWEPLSETCFVPDWRTPRTVSSTEVLAYQRRNGLWQVASRAALAPGDTWLSEGTLYVDGVPFGASSPEDLQQADATYVHAASHRAPCAEDWVLEVSDAGVSHARLASVTPGGVVSFEGTSSP
jgi:hypothetical protein